MSTMTVASTIVSTAESRSQPISICDSEDEGDQRGPVSHAV
jgi:hypothetical protein